MTTEDLGRGQIQEGSDAERAEASIPDRFAAPAPVAPPMPGEEEAAPAEAGPACGGNPEDADTPPPADNVIRIPDGVEIKCVEADKGFNKVTLFLSDGSRIVIDDPDHMPTIIVDGAEVPKATLQAMMNNAPCVEGPLSVPGSGGEFAVEPKPIGDPFDLTPLLPPTELPPLELPPPEFIEVINAREIPEVQVAVDEEALDDQADGLDLASGVVFGTNPDSTAETVTGSLNLSGTVGGEVTAITFDGTTVGPGETLITDHGVIVVNADGTFIFTLTNPADHTSGEVFELIDVEVTDTFGNVIEGTIKVNIIDDEPLVQEDFAAADRDTVQSGDVLNGNVILDGDGDAFDEADTPGADGAIVTGVSNSDDPSSPVSGNVGVPVDDENGLGTIIINADGSFTFTANPNVSGTAVFTYTLTDGDGDMATTTVTVDVVDGSPLITNEENEVEESDLDQNALPDGDDLAPGNVTGSTPGGTDETTSGTIVFSDPQGDPVSVTSVTFNGNTVGAGAQINGDFGVLVVNADGTYTYTLTDNADHSGGSVTEVFTVEVTDGFGNTSIGTLTIDIVDDVPTAVADFDSVQSGGTETGNVITDSEGDGGEDTEGADGAMVTGVTTSDSGTGPVAGNVGAPIPDEGGLGTLTLNADGSYSFDANPNVSGTAIYTYTITDGDGNTSSTTLTIEVGGGTPVVGNDEQQVEESDLDQTALPDGDDLAVGNVTGSTPGGSDETVSGSITLNDPQGDPLTVTVTFDGNTVNAGTQINGDFGVLLLNADGTYTYTLTDNADHSGGPVSEVFTVEATDPFGNTSSGTITINIVDDVPTAVADFDAVQAGGTETGNVITDSEGDGGEDTEGADGAMVTGVTTSDSGTGPVAGNVGAPLVDEGGLGTLTLNADGSYSFDANSNVSGTAIYTYTITDGDGDTSTTTLTIEVENGTPVVGNDEQQVEESDLDQTALPDGDDLAVGNVTGSTPGGSDETVSGSITLNDPQGDPLTVTVTFDGNTVNAGTQINGDFGVLLLNADGTYTYTLTDNADHSGGPVSEVFTVEATDPFGNTSSGTITINIVDDVPTAVADFDSVQSGDATAGNVITDGDADGIDEADTEGADGAEVTGVAAGDSGGVDVNGNVGMQINGSFGVLTLNADGSYSYTADPNVSGTDVFTYTLTDGDGDTSTTTLTIEVDNGAPEVFNSVVEVDEFALDTNPLPDGDDLAPGTSTGTNPGASSETVTGTFTFSDPDGTAVVTMIAFGGMMVAAGDTIAGDHGLLVVEADGSFTYTLTDHADHSGGAVSEVFTVTVTDAFGNANTGTITVNITNDVPIINSIQTGVLANEPGMITGEIDGAIGADEFDHYVLALQNSLDGVTISTTTLGDGSEQLTATIDSSGETFFILTFMPDGTYTFELVTERPVSEETFTLLNLSPGGPVLSVVAADGTVFTGLDGGLVNSSAQGFGVDNNNFDAGESFRTDFTSAVSTVTFETFDGGNPNATFTVDWEVFDENGVSLESGTIVVTGDEDIVIDPVVDEFFSVELHATQGSTKLLTFTKTVFLVPEDLTLLFDVDMFDTDGDSASGVLQIDLEGGDGASFTLTGTEGSDVLLGASTDDILNALGGDDDLFGGGGSDTYTGGTGDDVFVIDVTSLDMAVEDMITDYESGDTVDLTALFNDPTPVDVSDYVDYDPVTGELKVDADGGGPGGFVTVATVESGGSPVASVTILYEDGSDQQHTATIT